MATRPDETAKLKKRAAPAKKMPAARKAPAATKKPAEPGKAEVLLRAGLKALDNVRNDVAKRQANVIEGLLGIGQGKVPGLDSFGIRKFEDVFDQRVATAMQRLGMPGAEEVQALRDEVAQLRARVAQLEGPGAAAPPGRAQR